MISLYTNFPYSRHLYQWLRKSALQSVPWSDGAEHGNMATFIPSISSLSFIIIIIIILLEGWSGDGNW